MSMLTNVEFISHFANELAGVASALSERPTIVRPGGVTPGAGYLITIAAVSGGSGTLHVYLDRTGADQLVQYTLGAQESVPEADATAALKDMCTQVVASIVDGHGLDGVRLKVESVDAVAEVPAGASPTLLELLQDGSEPVAVALWGTLQIGSGDLPAAAAGNTGPASRHSLDNPGPQLEVILDMELPLVVRFGRTEMPLKALTELAPGTVIDLGRSPDDPVDVLVSNQIVARGEVVVVGGNYGVRITDIISPADRVRCIEAFV